MILSQRVFLATIITGLFPILIMSAAFKTSAEVAPTETEGNRRCQLGVTKPNDPEAFKEGEECFRKSVPGCLPTSDTPSAAAGRSVAAASFAANPYVTSTCK